MIRKSPMTGAYCAAVVSALAFVPSSYSQAVDTSQPVPATKSAQPTTAAADEDLVVLSPFVVDSTKDDGYQAKNTLAGTRIRTSLKDVGSSISVVTSSFLKDTNSKNAQQLLVYSANTEVAGQGGNFLGQGDGPFVTASAANKPVANTRVRGLSEADNTRDFYLSDIPWDSYNVGRVDLQRGPNSILFGIGSPAGIVNSSLNGAAFKDQFKVENQLGSFGTKRFSGNFNKVILKDELAVRVDLLKDATKYKQDPAFRDDKRVFAALRWDPAFLKFDSARTSFRANYEKGNIDSNLPRYTPPIDTITPWFSALNRATYDARTMNNGVPNAYVGPIANRVYDGVATAFDGATQGISFSTSFRNWPNTGGNANGANAGNNSLKGIATTNLYAQQAGLPGAGSGLWKARSLTDASVFDFYNNLIEGPNKSEFNRFEATNLVLSQTFLNDKIGIEVAYDHQKARWGNDTSMSDDGTTVTVDIVNTLLDGSANPNVGRPMVIMGGGSAGVYREQRTRDSFRATAFAEVNFNDISGKDSMLGKILGRNTFTGLFNRQTDKDQNQHGVRYYLSGQFAPNVAAGGVGQASRDDIILAYVGGDLRGKTSASGLNFQGIKDVIKPSSTGTVNVWNNVTNAFQAVPLQVVNSDDYTDEGKSYTSGAKSQNVIKSTAIVWQGYWLDNALIPMVGLRKDNLVSMGASAPDMPGVGGLKDINSLNWRLYKIADATKGLTYQDETGTSKTYSIVTHIPKSLINKMPAQTDIGFFYNKSENFKPEARRDILGAALPSATGETKEYGMNLTTLNDRLSLKVVHYETTVKNASIDGALNGFYLIGAVEWWGGNAARAQRDINNWQAGNFGTATNGKVLPVAPDINPANTTYNAHLRQVLTAAGQPLSTGTNPDGSLIFSQLAIDTTQADYAASINDWFAKLAPANMQAAWEFVSTANGVNNKDGNYGPSLMSLTGTTKSKGWEIEAVATPIEGLDVSFNASKTSAQRSELAASYGAWIVQRWRDLQGPMGDIRIWGGAANGETTRSKFRNETYAGYLFYNALQGSDVPELSPWRYSVVGNYGFKQTVLKGANIGAGYRWQEAKIIGFLSKSAADPVSGNPIDVADLSKPVKGKAESVIDLWVGYQHKIYKDVNWRIQFNVRNVFGKNELIPNSIQPTGEIATYRIAEPRTFTLTNTFEF